MPLKYCKANTNSRNDMLYIYVHFIPKKQRYLITRMNSYQPWWNSFIYGDTCMIDATLLENIRIWSKTFNFLNIRIYIYSHLSGLNSYLSRSLSYKNRVYICLIVIHTNKREIYVLGTLMIFRSGFFCVYDFPRRFWYS